MDCAFYLYVALNGIVILLPHQQVYGCDTESSETVASTISTGFVPRVLCEVAREVLLASIGQRQDSCYTFSEWRRGDNIVKVIILFHTIVEASVTTQFPAFANRHLEFRKSVPSTCTIFSCGMTMPTTYSNIDEARIGRTSQDCTCSCCNLKRSTLAQRWQPSGAERCRHQGS